MESNGTAAEQSDPTIPKSNSSIGRGCLLVSRCRDMDAACSARRILSVDSRSLCAAKAEPPRRSMLTTIRQPDGPLCKVESTMMLRSVSCASLCVGVPLAPRTSELLGKPVTERRVARVRLRLRKRTLHGVDRIAAQIQHRVSYMQSSRLVPFVVLYLVFCRVCSSFSATVRSRSIQTRPRK